jgi:Uma2 family endonuclease
MATDRTILRLGQQDEGRYVSSEEFADAEFDEPWRFEREDGRLIVMAPAGEGHSDATESWRDWLGAYRLAHRQIVQRVACEAWVRVDDGNDRIADIAVYLYHEKPLPSRPDRVPDLIFEVVSADKRSRDRDYIEKKVEYHRLGVKEYVIIDRFQEAVTVLTYHEEGYSERQLMIEENYESPLLPGLSIPLSDVF